MFMQRLRLVHLCAILLLLPVSGFAEDHQAAVLANPCAGCHGSDGASPGSIPPINSLSADDIIKALKDYKSGTRGGSVMNRIATGYTDEEIERIAHYFSGAKH